MQLVKGIIFCVTCSSLSDFGQLILREIIIANQYDLSREGNKTPFTGHCVQYYPNGNKEYCIAAGVKSLLIN
jgi:hypothetical protein